MSEMQLCPTCNGAGELIHLEQAVYYEYSDGSSMENPQIREVLSSQICGQCHGHRWIEGGSR